MVNLTAAVEELVRVYAFQRWIWMVCGILMVASLVTLVTSSI
jgi:hypothetical protein